MGAFIGPLLYTHALRKSCKATSASQADSGKEAHAENKEGKTLTWSWGMKRGSESDL